MCVRYGRMPEMTHMYLTQKTYICSDPVMAGSLAIVYPASSALKRKPEVGCQVHFRSPSRKADTNYQMPWRQGTRFGKGPLKHMNFRDADAPELLSV